MLEYLFHIDLISLIKSVSYLGIFGIIFAESGLLIGVVFPGDSLLFTAGFLASQDYLNIWVLCGTTFVAALVGDSTGYWIGRRVGPKVFVRPDSLIFRKQYVDKTQLFFAKHGGKSLVLARFMPIIRTFAPVAAGIGEMKYSTFLFYNLIGGLLWAVGISLAGYYLGNVPVVKKYFEIIIFGIVFLSVLPLIYHLLKDPTSRKGMLKLLRLRA